MSSRTFFSGTIASIKSNPTTPRSTLYHEILSQTLHKPDPPNLTPGLSFVKNQKDSETQNINWALQ